MEPHRFHPVQCQVVLVAILPKWKAWAQQVVVKLDATWVRTLWCVASWAHTQASSWCQHQVEVEDVDPLPRSRQAPRW